MKKITCLAVLLCFAIISFSQQLAFPTAEGFGKFVTGGRGTTAQPTTVFEVTSLDDTNTPGTLRYAVQASASTYPRRTIVFRVSGTIHLTSQLTLSRANTTIAGQTAPGDGICIADYPFSINADNVIIRYIRFRLGDKNQNLGMVNGSGDGDALTCLGKKNIIIDHCTMSWSSDETFSIYRGDSTTLQWNIISEPLDYSYHFETGDTDFEKHAYGGIWGGQHTTAHHNLIAHIRGRAPRFDGNRNLSAGQQERVDFRNNVIYNWADYNTNGGESGNYNIVNNYYKYGPNTANSSTSGVNRRNMIIQPFKQSSPSLPYGKYFLDGNYVDNSTAVTARNWLGAAMSGGSFADTVNSKMTVAYNFDQVNTHTAQQAYEYVLKYAGASLRRDTLDARMANDVRNRTGKIIDVQGGYPHGTAYSISQSAWPVLTGVTAPTDTDHDGMPDAWEIRRGLNPNLATDRYAVNVNGYTNLENYLNGDSAIARGITNTCVTGRSLFASASGEWLQLTDTTYAIANSIDTFNVIASVRDNVSGIYEAKYFTTNTTRTYNSIPYLNRNITIAPPNATTVAIPVIVRLYFTTAEFNALKLADPSINSVADLAVFVINDISCPASLSGNPVMLSQTASGAFGTYADGYYIEFTTTHFGSFFIAKNTAVFPLRLLSFTGVQKDNATHLKWQTVNEVNTEKFVIERSDDGYEFKAIGTVKAKSEITLNNYNFIDKIAIKNKAYYRLKMQDKSGLYTYSNIVEIKNNTESVLNIIPNPVINNEVLIKHTKAQQNASLKLIDISGKVLLTQKINAGAVQTQLNINTLVSGVYFIMYNNNGTLQTEKLIKK